METSSARNHSKSSASSSSMSSNRSMSKSKTYSDNISSGGSTSGRNDSSYSSYQNGGEMPDLNSAEFKREKEDYFGRVQRENANRRE